MSAPAVTTRPARKSDAAEIALLVNIATHGGIAGGWQHDERAGETYDPAEIGRLDMLREDDAFSWRNVTIAEADGEVAGMLLGYPEPERPAPMPADTAGFFVPLYQLEAEAAGLWFISMLGVHFTWRSKGVGSVLLDVAEHKRNDTGARGLALIVEDHNDGACRLYQRRGFAVKTQRPMRTFAGHEQAGRSWVLMVKE